MKEAAPIPYFPLRRAKCMRRRKNTTIAQTNVLKRQTLCCFCPGTYDNSLHCETTFMARLHLTSASPKKITGNATSSGSEDDTATRRCINNLESIDQKIL